MDIVDTLVDPDFLLSILIVICVAATVLTLSSSLFPSNTLASRMKAVTVERQRLRAQSHEAQKLATSALRHQQKKFMKDIVERFSLSEWLYAEDAKARLAAAGFRGPQAETTFLFSRLMTPLLLFAGALFYSFGIAPAEMSLNIKALIIIGALYLGIKAPEIYLKNTTIKRQDSMRRALPDALDLLLICIESGMSIEHAFRRVSMEIGMQSVALAEELALTTAELSYLSERRAAYSNLATRTGLDGVKQIATSLFQAES